MHGTNYLVSSESVTEGHPDKMADQISDAILDAIIEDDPRARVACETLVTTGMALIAGEITTNTYVDMPAIVRATVKDIGYTDARMGFDYKTAAVLTSIDKQSPDIAQGVDEGEGLFPDQGAGDQGMMYGFACDETPELMPMPILLSHKLCAKLAELRKQGNVDFLRPDGKAQVSVRYIDGVPTKVEAVVVSTQHSPDVTYETLREVVIEEVIKPTLPKGFLDDDTKLLVNPTGRFVTGGPQGDCGLTGRKIIVDTYGGVGRHGGGAFSGKDPSKVDRSGAYMARFVAKNVVAAGLAKRCEVQIAYAIGVAEPVSVMVETWGTETIPRDRLISLVREFFDMRPAQIIARLDLLRPIFRKTAAYGHFGRNDADFTWEQTDVAELLQKAAQG